MMINALVEQLGLQPHPEGGFYRRTYESTEWLETPRGRRHAMTSIFYLLRQHEKSRWHRIQSTERWFHHSGGALDIHHFENGKLHSRQLGKIEDGFSPILDVPPNCWFASRPAADCAFVLVSCVVCPGFDFADFELADSDMLLASYPQYAELISLLS